MIECTSLMYTCALGCGRALGHNRVTYAVIVSQHREHASKFPQDLI